MGDVYSHDEGQHNALRLKGFGCSWCGAAAPEGAPIRPVTAGRSLTLYWVRSSRIPGGERPPRSRVPNAGGQTKGDDCVQPLVRVQPAAELAAATSWLDAAARLDTGSRVGAAPRRLAVLGPHRPTTAVGSRSSGESELVRPAQGHLRVRRRVCGVVPLHGSLWRERQWKRVRHQGQGVGRRAAPRSAVLDIVEPVAHGHEARGQEDNCGKDPGAHLDQAQGDVEPTSEPEHETETHAGQDARTGSGPPLVHEDVDRPLHPRWRVLPPGQLRPGRL
jgi:hypothetical protein